MILSFFFSAYVCPRHLHSFPTRRSSDLAGGDRRLRRAHVPTGRGPEGARLRGLGCAERAGDARKDRKSTRLNSSHVATSYAVFCLKKKNPGFDTAAPGADSPAAPARGAI